MFAFTDQPAAPGSGLPDDVAITIMSTNTNFEHESRSCYSRRTMSSHERLPLGDRRGLLLPQLARIIHECFAHSLDWYQFISGTARSGKPECSLDERLKELAAGK